MKLEVERGAEDGVSPCNSGLEDRDSICDAIDCGDKGKACCPDDSCNEASLFCSAGTCLPCGTTGIQACTGPPRTPPRHPCTRPASRIAALR